MSGILQTLIASIGGAITDTYFNLVTLLLPGNGTNGAQNNTFLDSSTNNFTITRNGNTTQGTFSPFSLQPGAWSNFNPDSDNGIGVATNAALNMGTGDFTVEAWVNTAKLPTTNAFQQSSGGYQCVFGTGPNVSATGTQLYIGVTNLFFDISSDGGGPISVAHNMVAGQWYHIAISRSGTTFRAFINGVLVQTATSSGSWVDGYNYGIMRSEPIGGYSGGWWYGYVSNFRLVKGTAVYTANFTPSPIPLTAITNTSLLTCQSNRFVDNSSNAFAITVNGTPSVQAFSPFAPTAAYSAATVGGSGYFDGSGDYLSFASNAAFTVGTGNLTIEAWIYVTSLSQAYQGIASGRADTSPNFPGLGLTIDNSQLLFTILNSGSGLRDSANVPLNQWVHVVGVRSGTNAALFVNGTRKASSTNSEDGTSSDMVIGRYYVGTNNYYLSGYIAGARLLKGTAAYDPTQTSITVPTAPFTNVTNTSFLTNFTNAGITDATAKNVLETVGNAQISTTQSKFGGSSMYFDGTGDYLLIPSSPVFALNGDATIEFWLRVPSLPSTYSNLFTINAGTALWIYLNSAGNIGIQTGSAYRDTTTAPISANTWYHVAITKTSGNTWTVYVNGTSQASSGTGTMASTISAAIVGIGATSAGANTLNGFIDDLRVSQFARYTSNFTAPTAAFALQ